MNTKIKDEVNTQDNFGTRCVASCRKILAHIEDVRDQVVAEFSHRLDSDKHMLDLALNEAEALAWDSGFPQLFFPTLATEKARAVTGWHVRQQYLRQRTATLLAA